MEVVNFMMDYDPSKIFLDTMTETYLGHRKALLCIRAGLISGVGSSSIPLVFYVSDAECLSMYRKVVKFSFNSNIKTFGLASFCFEETFEKSNLIVN